MHLKHAAARANLVWSLVLLLCALLLTQPAEATRLTSDLSDLVALEFPGAKIRMDGAFETNSGDLFILVIPGNPANKKRVKIELQNSYPNREHPDVLVYSNGWCYLKVRKKGKACTVILPGELPEKLRKQLAACHFPSDLIVPENFLLPQSFKLMVGDTAVQTANDASIASPDFGHIVKEHVSRGNLGPGSFALTSLGTGIITLLDGLTLTKTADFPTEGTPCSMAWAEGLLYITDQAKNRVLMLDAVKRQFLGQIDLAAHSAPRGIAALPNGRLLYVAESGSNDIAIIEIATKKVLMRTKVSPGPGQLVVTPNGNFVIAVNVPSGLVTFLSTLNQSVVGTVKVGDIPTSIAVTQDSSTAYISNRGSNTVSILEIASRKILGSITTGTGPTGLALSSDESKLYVAQAKENTIGVYDTKTRAKIAEAKLPLDVDFPNAISLTPGGQQLLVSSGSTDTIATLDLTKMQFDKQSTIGHSSHNILWLPVK